MAKNNHGKGVSLAKGPVLIVGLALLAFGILALLPRVGGGSKDRSRRREEFSAERVVERERVDGPGRASATRTHRDASWDERSIR
jgi:hypothetical protein